MINVYYIIFIIILICYYQVYCLLIPESFQDNHKRSYQKDITTSNLLKILSLYEIDSHIEIVLLGKIFNYKVAEDLSKTLDILSSTSRKFTPLKYVHEKLIYHVTISTSLEKQIYDIIALNNTVKEENISKLLSDYHIRATTTTTLFIMYFEDIYGNYSYISPLSYCSQSAFIASSGYAWLDLSSKTSIVTPTFIEKDIVLVPDFSKLVLSGKKSNLYQLASLIHRSGEALIPFPLSNKDFIQMIPLPSNSFTSSEIMKNSISSIYTVTDISREIQIVLITICVLDDVTLCDDDKLSYSTIEQLCQIYSTSSLKVGFTTIRLNIHNEPELSHAIHSSTRFTDSQNVKILSSSELVYWLGSSSKMREHFSNLNGNEWGLKEKKGSVADKKILPVFSFLLPTSVEVFFEDYHKTIFVNFPEPPGGWGISKLDGSEDAKYANEIASRLIWPNTAVLHLQQSVTKGVLQSTGLQCDGIVIPATRSGSIHQLKVVLREAIWGIPPPHLHYNGVSQKTVHDYLWISHSSIFSINENLIEDTFREKRAVPRNNLIKRCEYIISRFASIIQTAEAIYPPVNMTHLLGMGLSTQSIPKIEQGSKKVKQFKFNSIDVKLVSDPDDIDNKGLLEDFLVALDDAATDISHLEYDIAYLRINNAETKLLNIEKEINIILSNRQGKILFVDDDVNDSIPLTSSFTMSLFIIISIFVGGCSALIIRKINF